MKNNLIKDVIEDTTQKLVTERLCRTCIFSNDTCDWCMENKIKLHKAQYGCNKHMTRQDAIRRQTEIEYEKYTKELSRLALDMDVMGYAINAASIMLEKLDNELEASYNSLENPTNADEKSHKESKKNRERLRKAYSKMKFNAMDMRNTFNDYVEYFFTYNFTDQHGNFNEKESDKNLVNSGIIAKFIKVFVDRCLDNKENGELIINYMLSLKGSGIYGDRDFNKVMIR